MVGCIEGWIKLSTLFAWISFAEKWFIWTGTFKYWHLPFVHCTTSPRDNACSIQTVQQAERIELPCTFIFQNDTYHEFESSWCNVSHDFLDPLLDNSFR